MAFNLDAQSVTTEEVAEATVSMLRRFVDACKQFGGPPMDGDVEVVPPDRTLLRNFTNKLPSNEAELKRGLEKVDAYTLLCFASEYLKWQMEHCRTGDCPDEISNETITRLVQECVANRLRDAAFDRGQLVAEVQVPQPATRICEDRDNPLGGPLPYYDEARKNLTKEVWLVPEDECDQFPNTPNRMTIAVTMTDEKIPEKDLSDLADRWPTYVSDFVFTSSNPDIIARVPKWRMRGARPIRIING